ncbi:TonB-dependent receptor [uncultured Thiodictyon sp.]|uniref:TonB-dependent receptor n=1 Tax=uncultured Thiodictyon sp. TaxID=1846217 RepID=UPI0025F284EB|nr:TonB-dependent receptor [uncultured Thiodictyon sp.]
MMAVIARMALWPLLLLAGVAVAGEARTPSLWERLQGDRLQIHGFASVTGIQTSANRFLGSTRQGSVNFIEVALNASYQFNPRVLFSGQVLARRAGSLANGSPVLDYGLVDVTLAETVERRFGVRVGRLKNPLGLYNETRDVPFTRPSIFLPQVVYFDKVRNLVLSTDGVMFYGETATGYGDFSLTLGSGQPVVDENLEWAFLGGNYPGKFEPHGLSWVGSLWYSALHERLRLGVSGITSSLRYRPGRSGPDLPAGQTDITYLILSAQYNAEHWTLTSEYSRLPLRWQGYGASFPYRKTDGEGYYLQGTYRVLPTLDLVLRYEEGFTDRTDRSGRRLSAAVGGMSPPSDYFAKIWTFGVRWDLDPHVMLSAEYERHQGTYTTSYRENGAAALVRDWDLFALQIAVRF